MSFWDPDIFGVSFEYVVSCKGETGARTKLPEGLASCKMLPMCASEPFCLWRSALASLRLADMVEGVANLFDGAIIGSATSQTIWSKQLGELQRSARVFFTTMRLSLPRELIQPKVATSNGALLLRVRGSVGSKVWNDRRSALGAATLRIK